MEEKNRFNELEKQYLAIVESESDAIITSDETKTITSWNKGAVNLFGYNSTEVLGKPITLIIPEKYREAHKKGMQRLNETGKPAIIGTTVELEGLKKDGSVFSIELTLGFWPQDGKKYYSAIIRDISIRKMNEKIINDQNKRFQIISQSENDAILTSDKSRNILSWNKGAEKIFGYTEGEVLGKPIALIVPEKYRKAHEAGMNRLSSGGKPKVVGQAIEITALKKDGREFPIELTLGTWQSSSGNMYFSGIIRDITDRKEAERTILEQNRQISEEKEKSDTLLKNILPEQIIPQLIKHGKTEPKNFKQVSIMFTDIIGFTGISEKMPPDQLVRELNGMFSHFDFIVKKLGLEKIKTIGDAYMCAGGLPEENNTHALDCVVAAFKFLDYIRQKSNEWKKEGKKYWKIRIGIHTGPVLAGVVGTWKFTYDIWGDSVNIAARMEQSGKGGKINVSRETYKQIKDFFECSYRGKVQAKNKGEMDMYIIDKIKKELSVEQKGLKPNKQFQDNYRKLQS